MPARVNNELLIKAAEALINCAQSMTNEAGLGIHCKMDDHQAKSIVLASMVWALGYPNAVMPTGWIEVSFGKPG